MSGAEGPHSCAGARHAGICIQSPMRLIRLVTHLPLHHNTPNIADNVYVRFVYLQYRLIKKYLLESACKEGAVNGSIIY